MFMSQLYEACRNYETLELDVRGTPRAFFFDENELLLSADAFPRLVETRLKELTFKPLGQLFAMLAWTPKYCPLLETLRLSAEPGDEGSYKHLVAILRNNNFPHLRNLKVENAVSRQHSFDEPLADIVRAIGQSRKDQDNNVNGRESRLERRGLESFRIGTRFSLSPNLVCALTECHAHTLTVLDLENVKRMGFPELVECMTKLPLLRSLQVITSLEYDEKDAGLMKPWICLGLERLTIELLKINPKPCPKYDFYIFSQVARLTNLREWTHQHESIPYKIDPGYLRQLSQLKKLVSLGFFDYFVGDFGEPEAIWMIKNWPRLAHMKGVCPDSLLGKALVQRRPWIEFEQE
ncbi:hypothetical protein BGZ80_010178 [Entomortierella chlamydospora]|uniref:Uncharacterized protein n=1 Tax=Entomortierella chlamydospora TaxID=101097 RepID=A0A9P6MVR3_9FUNG|nr:hypothetical protein BGZ80_010178 [Entomortierella chlamydospora]